GVRRARSRVRRGRLGGGRARPLGPGAPALRLGVILRRQGAGAGARPGRGPLHEERAAVGARLLARRGGGLPLGRRDRGGRRAPARGVPASGDLVRGRDVWLVVGADRLVALAAPAAAKRIVSAPPTDAADGAARACLRARRSGAVADLAAAASLVASARSRETEALLEEAARAALEAADGPAVALASAGPERTLAVLAAVGALPP